MKILELSPMKPGEPYRLPMIIRGVPNITEDFPRLRSAEDIFFTLSEHFQKSSIQFLSKFFIHFNNKVVFPVQVGFESHSFFSNFTRRFNFTLILRSNSKPYDYLHKCINIAHVRMPALKVWLIGESDAVLPLGRSTCNPEDLDPTPLPPLAGFVTCQ